MLRQSLTALRQWVFPTKPKGFIMKKNILLSLIVACSLVLVTGCKKNENIIEKKEEAEVKTENVEVSVKPEEKKSKTVLYEDNEYFSFEYNEQAFSVSSQDEKTVFITCLIDASSRNELLIHRESNFSADSFIESLKNIGDNQKNFVEDITYINKIPTKYVFGNIKNIKLTYYFIPIIGAADEYIVVEVSGTEYDKNDKLGKKVSDNIENLIKSIVEKK